MIDLAMPYRHFDAQKPSCLISERISPTETSKESPPIQKRQQRPLQKGFKNKGSLAT